MRTASSILLLVISIFIGVSAALSLLGLAGSQSRASAAELTDAMDTGVYSFEQRTSSRAAEAEPVMQPPQIPPSDLASERIDAAPRPMPMIPAAPAELQSPQSPGTIFTVVNTNDSGAGSLRDAVSQANTAAGQDEIHFSLTGCPCVIAFGSEIAITDDLTITGPGSNLLTLDGMNSTRMLNASTPGINLIISNLTLSQGFHASTSGGGVTAGNLTLTNVNVNNCTAPSGGGVVANGNLTLVNTVFQNNTAATGYGGGAFVSQQLFATNAIFASNSAYTDGGGVYVSGNATLTGGSFDNNQTTQVKSYGGGGGMMAFGVSTLSGTQFTDNNTPAWGGGAYLANFSGGTTNRLTNASFSGNSSTYGGGGLFQWFNASITNTDFISNQAGTQGGGLYAGYAGLYAIRLHRGLIQGNTAAAGGGLHADGGFTLQGVEVISNTATQGRGGGANSLDKVTISDSTFTYNTVITGGNGGGLAATVQAIITDTSFVNNQVLGTIAARSGGGLVVGTSQGAGDANLLRATFTGNRSYRGFGGGMLAYGSTRIIDSTFSDNSSWNDGGGAWTGGALMLSGGLFQGNRTLWYEGGGGGGGLMSMAQARISGTHFISNTTADWGGGAYIYAPSSSSRFTNTFHISNTATNGGGGGLFAWFTATLESPTFSDNYASYQGGGLYASYAGNYQPRVMGGSFTGNSAIGGGGMYSDGEIRLEGVVFTANTARSGNGGGAWAYQSARVENSLFTLNQVLAGGNSGGLDVGTNAWLTDTVFISNKNLTGSAGGSGSGGNTTVLRGEYRQNQAANDGGGLLAFGTATISGTQFFSNTTGDLGGGIAVSHLVGRNNLIQGNTSSNAGGGIFTGLSFSLRDSSLVSNQAASSGGGLYSPASALTLSDSEFRGNSAGDRGGGAIAAQATITRTSFTNNSAGSRGGGLMLTAGSNSVVQTAFLDNQASAGGGLAFEGSAGGSVVNSLLAGNAAIGGSGGALYLDTSGVLTVQHGTIASPSLASASAVYLNAGSLIAENTILTNHTTGLVRISGSAVLQNPLFYGNGTNTQGTGITVNGAVNGNPAFFDPSGYDYHLSSGSLAANAGVASGVNNDYDGDPRPQGGQADIGYDEAVTPSGVNFTHDAPKSVNQPVSFSGSAAFGQGVVYNWTFGDGNSAQGQSVSHAYTQPGIYVVTLTAANAAGQNQAIKNVTITKVDRSVYLPLVIH
jgi:predicted outer membrane repeat protein